MRSKQLVLFVAAGILVGVFGISPATSQSDVEPDIFRVMERHEGDLVTSLTCEGIDCVGFGARGETFVSFPASMGMVDVTVTMTLDYDTTPGDGAKADMSMKSPGEPKTKMRPGIYHLRPGASTTTSLTWFRRNVDATAGEHKLTFGLGTGNGAEPDWVIRGSEVVLVIEATPS